MSGTTLVIIACRNRDKYIAQSLDSIIANGYPKEQLVLVVDETQRITSPIFSDGSLKQEAAMLARSASHVRRSTR